MADGTRVTVHEVRPIGTVANQRSAVEDDDWGGVVSTILLDPAVVDADATAGLETFSHVLDGRLLVAAGAPGRPAHLAAPRVRHLDPSVAVGPRAGVRAPPGLV